MCRKSALHLLVADSKGMERRWGKGDYLESLFQQRFVDPKTILKRRRRNNE
jgi:hypothetical protein